MIPNLQTWKLKTIIVKQICATFKIISLLKLLYFSQINILIINNFVLEIIKF